MKKALPKIQYNAPVILTMALISAIALVLDTLTHGAANKVLFSVYRSSLLSPLTYVRIFTYILGHANYAHFIGNFTLILCVGPMLEEKYGSKQLLEMIAVTAFVTGLIQMVFFPGTALLGASGVAFMLILLSSFANYQKGKIPLTLILVAIIYLSGEVIDGIQNPDDNISQMGHIIGGLCGTFFGWIITKPAKEPENTI